MKVTDNERIRAANARYAAAAHAMQTGVAMEMNYDDAHSPKHLRVGVNSALVDVLGLVRLLMSKGIIEEVEYHEAMADAMEEEAKRYADNISKHFGRRINLG